MAAPVRRIVLDDVAVEAAGVLRRRSLRYVIAGFYAGGYWLGIRVHRATFDLDISVFVEDLGPAIRDFEKRGWFVRRRFGASTKMRHLDHPFRLDFFHPHIPLVGPRGQYDASGLVREIWRRGKDARVGRERVRLARPEDVVVLKCISLLLGYDKPEHPRDIQALVKYARIERALLARTLRNYGLMAIYRAVVSGQPVPETSPKGFFPAKVR